MMSQPARTYHNGEYTLEEWMLITQAYLKAPKYAIEAKTRGGRWFHIGSTFNKNALKEFRRTVPMSYSLRLRKVTA
jgi:hypothetical protein